MPYLDQHLENGEHILYRVQRNRKWTDVAMTLAIDAGVMLAVWFVFDRLQRAFVESYIRSTMPVEGAEFMVFNLFLGILPFVLILALVQDLVFSFFSQLALTEGRIFGQISGPFWMKEVSIKLEDVERVSARIGCLHIVARGERYFLPGFYDTGGFIQAYRKNVAGERINAGLCEPISTPVSISK